ncbi:MAG TPA: tetratricopeptide repeat protein [Gemmatimonadaceae bacterium]|nr:tetratricopeptide repeat protein [Gemmatimonadaceae bacterium]HRQ77353.1 tetratricopeptide repeat protein [Gemmatimonadaceae bacterium]
MEERPSAPDPYQLPLGVFGAESAPDAVTAGEELVSVPLREPPVCGEWSYDDSELEETRFVARRIDGVLAPTSKATPIQPIRVVVDQRAMAARAAAAQRGPGNVAPGQAPTGSGAGRAAEPMRSLRPTLEALRLAFEHSPSDTARALAYIAAQERSNDAAGALKSIEKAEAAGADPFAMTCARASALGASLRYDDAAKAIKAAQKLRPDHPEVLVQTGILAGRRGRWKDAIEPLQRGIAGDPEHAQAHYYAGEALNHADRLDEARAAYERAATLDPENWRALKGIGIVLDRLGRSPEAAEWYRRAREAQRQ